MYDIGVMPAPADFEFCERLAGVETATVGHWRLWGFMDRRIQAILPQTRMVGVAVTLALPYTDSTLLHYALTLVRPGDTLVIDRLGDDKHACLGGAVALAGKLAGIAGVVIDGPCTDVSEIATSGLKVWCRGISPVTTKIANIGGRLNRPIACGGVVVSPGDIVLADESGVLILPPEEVHLVAKQALLRQKRSNEVCGMMKKGIHLAEISGAGEMIRKKISGC